MITATPNASAIIIMITTTTVAMAAITSTAAASTAAAARLRATVQRHQELRSLWFGRVSSDSGQRLIELAAVPRPVGNASIHAGAGRCCAHHAIAVVGHVIGHIVQLVLLHVAQPTAVAHRLVGLHDWQWPHRRRRRRCRRLYRLRLCRFACDGLFVQLLAMVEPLLASGLGRRLRGGRDRCHGVCLGCRNHRRRQRVRLVVVLLVLLALFGVGEQLVLVLHLLMVDARVALMVRLMASAGARCRPCGAGAARGRRGRRGMRGCCAAGGGGRSLDGCGRRWLVLVVVRMPLGRRLLVEVDALRFEADWPRPVGQRLTALGEAERSGGIDGRVVLEPAVCHGFVEIAVVVELFLCGRESGIDWRSVMLCACVQNDIERTHGREHCACQYK